ncbi:MAG: hypothetical protein AAGC81_13835 [Pseudomonadota bacterium]
MTPPWFNAVSSFAVFNLIVVPIVGQFAWQGMARLTESHGPLGGMMLSLLVVAAILGANIALYRWAARTGMPKLGLMVLFLIIGITFVLPIGTGDFSPITLAYKFLS